MANGLSTGNFAVLLHLTAYRDNDLSVVEDTLQLVAGVNFADGTAADQVNTMYSATRSLVEGANETLNIHNGSLNNNFGVPLALTKLKGLFIRNNSTSVNLTVGAAATVPVGLFNGTAAAIVLPFSETTNKAQFTFIAPAVAGIDVSTNCNIKMAAGGTGTASHTYDIVLVGVQ